MANLLGHVPDWGGGGGGGGGGGQFDEDVMKPCEREISEENEEIGAEEEKRMMRKIKSLVQTKTRG